MKQLHELPATPRLGENQMFETDTAPTHPANSVKPNQSRVQPSHSTTMDHLSTNSAEYQMPDSENYTSNFDGKLSVTSTSTVALSAPTNGFLSPNSNNMLDFYMNHKPRAGALNPSSPLSPDPIIEATNVFIEQERKRNFFFLANHSRKHRDTRDILFVTRANDDDVQRIRKKIGRRGMTSFHNRQWYAFSELLYSNNLRRVITIETIPDEPVIAANMKVLDPYDDGRVVMLDTWLRESYEWHDTYGMKFHDIQRNEQQLWWDSTGKTFRLLDLPLELRENIYLHTVGPVVLPDIVCSRNKQVTLGAGFSYGDRHRHGFAFDPDVEPPNMAILGINKKIRTEAMEVAYRDTFKRFRAVGRKGHSEARPQPRSSFYMIITGIRSLAPHTTFLRNMQLEMSAVRYFSFIGITPTPRDPVGLTAKLSGSLPKTRRVEADILSTFSALRILDLRFISPKHPEAVCPWTVNSDKTSSDFHSCQKLWIDWFLTFAWDYLKNLQLVKISLSGCVKDSTRIHWEKVLNDKRANWTPQLKRLEFEIWKNKSDMTPIPCVCSTPCPKASNPLAHRAWTQYDLRTMDGLQKELDKIYWDFKD